MAVTQLPGTEPIPKFTDLVAKMVEEFPAQLQFIEMKAVATRHAYKSLLAQGFSHKDALELATKITFLNIEKFLLLLCDISLL
jgi:hypothetical protein